MLIPDLLDQKKLVENIKQEKEQPLYPNTELWSGGHEPTPYYPNTELHADTPLEYGGRVRMGINQFMQPASQYVNEATNILPNLIITALKKMGLPVSGDPQKDFGTFLVYALTPNSPVEYYQTAKALLPYFSEAKQNLTAKPAYAEEVDTPEGKRMRLYHGTIYDFADEEISPNARKSSNYGIYMSPEENVAKAYARVPFHGDTGVKKYLLSQGAKVLDVSDGEEFWNWMIKNGVLGKEEIEDPTLYEKVTGGFLWEYDTTNKTRYANDAVRTAESMGYDAVIIPDWLPVDGVDEFSKTSAYVVMNPKVLEPGASDEALQARWDKYKSELEYDETIKPEELGSENDILQQRFKDSLGGESDTIRNMKKTNKKFFVRISKHSDKDWESYALPDNSSLQEYETLEQMVQDGAKKAGGLAGVEWNKPFIDMDDIVFPKGSNVGDIQEDITVKDLIGKGYIVRLYYGDKVKDIQDGVIFKPKELDAKTALTISNKYEDALLEPSETGLVQVEYSPYLYSQEIAQNLIPQPTDNFISW